MGNSIIKSLIVSIIIFAISGCATLPKPLEEIPALRNVSLELIKSSPDKFYDVSILWGGRIINCVNEEDGTLFEILHLPLDLNGHPLETNKSEGRFLTKSKSFLDCAIYSKGRFLTVIGKFRGLKEGKIDRLTYSYPFLEAQAIYLWSRRVYYPYWRPMFWFWYGTPRVWFEFGPW